MKRSFGGFFDYHARVISADISTFYRGVLRSNIPLGKIRHINELNISISFRGKDLDRVKELCNETDAELQILSGGEPGKAIGKWLRRPVLHFGVLLVLVLTVWVPSVVLFLQVEGNVSIPDYLVLEAASQCGLSFGSKRSGIRSEQIKNALLERLPQLRWVGVNTAGCVAKITVSERELLQTVNPYQGVSRIVAVRDAIVDSCVVSSGTPMCTPGQAVKQGQTLVSGYENTGILMKGTRANGEVFGQTMHCVNVVMPAFSHKKGDAVGEFYKYGIMIGKKQINFFNNSRIFGGICDKMYEQYRVTLPGGFVLPLGLFVITTTVYEEISDVDYVSDDEALKAFVRSYLNQSMVSGQIQSAVEIIETQGDCSRLTGYYICQELIGREQTEEMIVEYGKDH